MHIQTASIRLMFNKSERALSYFVEEIQYQQFVACTAANDLRMFFLDFRPREKIGQVA